MRGANALVIRHLRGSTRMFPSLRQPAFAGPAVPVREGGDFFVIRPQRCFVNLSKYQLGEN